MKFTDLRWLVRVGLIAAAVQVSGKAEEPTVPAPPQSVLAPPKAADSRLALPSLEARHASEERVKEIFAGDYAIAGTVDKKSELAKRLVEQAASTNEPADRWALLSEGLRLATEAGDAAVALPLIDRIPTEFAVSGIGPRIEALSRLAKKTVSSASDEVAAACIALAREAEETGDEANAAKVIALAAGIAKKTKNTGLLADTARLQQKSKEQQKLKKELESLLSKVQQSPADPEANLLAGRALCLKGNRWSVGLPLLVKGSDSVLVRVATAEIATPTALPEITRLADAWWDWAESQKPPWKLAAQARAVFLYARVVDDLQGLDKARVEKRIATVAAAGGGTDQTMFLADLEEAEVKGVINNFLSKNGTLGAAFTVSGKPYPKAVMALPDSNATSTVAYRLPAGVVRARGRVGVFTPKYAKPTDQPAAPIAFQLVADGEIVWSSPPLNKRDDTATFDVAIRNAAKLELLTTCTGHNNNAWAAWLDPVIVK
jgi:hypothetical protein